MTQTSMADNETPESTVETDGGLVTGTGQAHRDTDYLDCEVNLLQPSTPFMRDHLRVIWTGFVGWVLVVFGPVTLTAIAPNAMTTQIPGMGFPLHYFLVAIGGPGGALLLAVWYARKRDQLDRKYGIDHGTARESDSTTRVVAADGGEAE